MPRTADQELSEPDAHDGLPSAPRDRSTLLPTKDLAAVYDAPAQVAAVLGKADMPVSRLLELGRGGLIELDRQLGDAIDIYVNGRLVARGEVVVVADRLGVRLTEVLRSDQG